MAPKLPALLLLIISLTNASLIPNIEVLQGPSSRTTVVGPDGSALSAAAPGGTVVTDSHGAGLVAAAPAVLASAPEIIVSGPAGSIATSHTLAGPAVVPAAPAVTAPPAVAANSAVLLGDIETHDGAYVPDNTELLYDDGSYKGEH
ncbi:hypothetical protein NQ314_009761 [Rhamnusium bicolor]|uniref:Uncharacterized protein n=1 Tax=Rhamnusium bicolor TaxID=1586634 RepID=A0AAV8XWB7_9CUCU|nr:hypothetical protein NQ314_009761 [Rhamnusium bicolor]